jgi:hypothetical protein
VRALESDHVANVIHQQEPRLLMLGSAR